MRFDGSAAPLARVLGVAGWQGSGKTTLLERLVPELVASGLSVVVVKHDVHGIDLDVESKDSDRLFRAGAEVVLDGPGERMARGRPLADGPLPARLLALSRRCDLVLVEGYKREPHAKVWLLRPGEAAAPDEAAAVLAALPWDAERPAILRALIEARLDADWASQPRRAGVLVGGASRRMGTPKHELLVGGEPLLARIAAALAPAGPVMLLGGAGRLELPGAEPAAAEAGRLPDAPGVVGPLAGVLAALRWDPAAWTIASCDLPRLSAEAVSWLLAQRRPGRWAVMPRVHGVVQPLLAVYEPQALPLLEAITAGGPAGPSQLAGHPHVATPEPPPELADAWRGVNTPEELAAL